MVSKTEDGLEILSRNLGPEGIKIWQAQSIFGSVLGLGLLWVYVSSFKRF